MHVVSHVSLLPKTVSKSCFAGLDKGPVLMFSTKNGSFLAYILIQHLLKLKMLAHLYRKKGKVNTVYLCSLPPWSLSHIPPPGMLSSQCPCSRSSGPRIRNPRSSLCSAFWDGPERFWSVSAYTVNCSGQSQKICTEKKVGISYNPL